MAALSSVREGREGRKEGRKLEPSLGEASRETIYGQWKQCAAGRQRVPLALFSPLATTTKLARPVQPPRRHSPSLFPPTTFRRPRMSASRTSKRWKRYGCGNVFNGENPRGGGIYSRYIRVEDLFSRDVWPGIGSLGHVALEAEKRLIRCKSIDGSEKECGGKRMLDPNLRSLGNRGFEFSQEFPSCIPSLTVRSSEFEAQVTRSSTTRSFHPAHPF